MSLFTAEQLTAGYGGAPVVQQVSFALEAGCVLGILGANGSGKTTLLKSICGILPHSGRCTLDGAVLEELNARQTAQLCGYIPQRSGITLSMPVLDVVLMGFNPRLGLLQQPTAAMQAVALQALEQVGLAHRAQEDYLTLSEGQKQLCILARTLAADTKLLLLDEPESALDFGHRHRLMELVRSRVTGQRQIGFYAPVSFQDEIIGVMVGFYGEEYLRSRLGFDLFGYQGEGWLIARDGAVLGATQAEIPDNFYTYLRDGDRCTEEELDRLIRSVGDSRSTAFTIRDDDTDVTSYAVCLEICDWVLIRSFPANVARQIQRGSILEGQRLVMILVALFISYTLLVGIRTLMEKRQMQKNLMNANEKAYKDALTRVKNKAAYDEYIDQLERDIQSQAVREFSILVCDINNLKDINDHLGHIEGDRYIREASHLICRYWAHSPVFRIGGDEFAVLIMNADYRDRDRLLEEMRQEIRENMKQGKVAVATGMSVFDPENDKTFTQVFDRADALMYENKSDLKA